MADSRTKNRLFDAIGQGDIEAALKLITPGEWLNGTNAGGATPLMSAIAAKSLPIVEALLAAGANPSATGAQGETALHIAARSGQLDMVRLLVEQGADVNARMTEGYDALKERSVLIDAAISNKVDVIRFLIEKGADPFAKDANGRTALFWAQSYGKRAAAYLTKVMSEQGAAAQLSVHDAARAKNLPRLKELADAGTPLDALETASGLAPLHIAAMGAWLDGVEFLLAHGVTPDRLDAQKFTPLMWAASAEHSAPVARALIAAGADVHYKSPKGHTILPRASEAELVNVLLSAGADPNRRHEESGHTDFLYACMLRDEAVLAAYLDAGADLKAVDIRGNGVEHYLKSNRPAARTFIRTRLGLAMTPVDKLREGLKSLPEGAKAPEFTSFAAMLGASFNRKPAPWKRRKGAIYFHGVSRARVFAHYSEPEPADAAIREQRAEELIVRLARDAREVGATLFYADALSEDDRNHFVLLPTLEPMAPLLCCGTNANLLGDTNTLVGRLMDIVAEEPFMVIGCGHDFIHAALLTPPKDAGRLAAALIAVCPDMVDQAEASLRRASPSEAARMVADDLARHSRFFLWWD